MANTRVRTSRVFTVSFPEDLANQVEETARRESRNISELFREAFRVYQFHHFERKLPTLRPPPDPSRPAPTQDEIEALVDEIRSEQYQRKFAK